MHWKIYAVAVFVWAVSIESSGQDCNFIWAVELHVQGNNGNVCASLLRELCKQHTDICLLPSTSAVYSVNPSHEHTHI